MAIEYVLAATLFFTPNVPGGSANAGVESKILTGNRAFNTLKECNHHWQRLIINEGPKYNSGSSARFFKRAEGVMCEPREAQAAVNDPRLVAQEAAMAEVLAKQKRLEALKASQ